jgi:hypothetical protein
VAKLKDKVQNALDEARILLLGAQVLVGFGYRAFFEEGFESLAGWAKGAAVAALALMLFAFCLTSMPASHHRLAAQGEDGEDVHAFANGALRLALLPIAVGMGLDFAIACARAVTPDPAVAGALGAAAAAVALGLWYAYTYGARARHGHGREEPAMEESQLTEKIRHVLTETRMVLPGAQALLGFQFAVTLMKSFEELPEPLRLLHAAVLGLISLSVVLLITPAAYHRIVEKGEMSEHFHRVASGFVLAAMVPLALGLCGDFLVVVYKVARSYAVAGAAAGAALTVFFGLWFGLTLALRRRRARGEGGRRPAALRPAQA